MQGSTGNGTERISNDCLDRKQFHGMERIFVMERNAFHGTERFFMERNGLERNGLGQPSQTGQPGRQPGNQETLTLDYYGLELFHGTERNGLHGTDLLMERNGTGCMERIYSWNGTERIVWNEIFGERN